ncbi:OLC1v1031095C1 [Oldenlandia corymbosa var. corymbosa]|uniref:OLC1v1031095C1 n=1 Tax=Oldenlandia corymbosa var. corymbosa TaxID=529605 RepID=A0AAV1CJF3_OLDCO|nr:OLC1v1031095C1 [Oldenlandia corymbosa var. corymbosa]
MEGADSEMLGSIAKLSHILRPQRQYMDPALYRAAQSGNWEVIKEYSKEDLKRRTGNGDSVLHVLAQSGDTPAIVNAVAQILAAEPGLVHKRNRNQETPLVTASRKGHSNVVRALLDCPRRINVVSLYRDLWLHPFVSLIRFAGFKLDSPGQAESAAFSMAVRHNRYDIIELFMEKRPSLFRYLETSSPVDRVLIRALRWSIRPTKTQVNQWAKSPLYVAVEKGYHRIVTLLLSSRGSFPYYGPGQKTISHAAAASNSPECMRIILEKRPDIMKEVDVYGWSALHYAAVLGHTEMVEQLLSKDSSIGYLVAGHDECKIPLHVAVIHGHLDVIQRILFRCPHSWGMITSKAQKILHLAIVNECQNVLDYILQNSWASELMNEKDLYGNTPLHLYVSTKNIQGYGLINHPGIDMSVLNKKGSTPLDTLTEGRGLFTRRQVLLRDERLAGANSGLSWAVPKVNKELGDEKLKNVKTYMVISTLILTMTFAAGLAVAVGYNSSKPNEGAPSVLARKAAFIVFVVADSLSMLLTIGTMLLQIFLKEQRAIWRKLDIFRDIKVYMSSALVLLVVAFVSGLCSVIPIRGLDIYSIVVGSIVCLPVAFYTVRLIWTYWVIRDITGEPDIYIRYSDV